VGAIDTGVLPASLQKLQANNNMLSGSLAFLGQLPSLTSVRLNNNKFTGYFPAAIASLNLLTNLYDWFPRLLLIDLGGFRAFLTPFRRNLQYNQLSGELPVQALSNNLLALTGLCLAGNHFTGPLPNLPQLCVPAPFRLLCFSSLREMSFVFFLVCVMSAVSWRCV